ncbi:MAG: hypothetical protein DWC06_01920 [Candidatus Poseidoniales archaeon]|nr:MAG: hypothetical protein DWC06_01920 [Candidatus Poseidoniales archaeon]|tara:strand:+ start:2603 stop:3886 length:1284 start_codon:yes stop_codon:yes gene_type:complete
MQECRVCGLLFLGGGACPSCGSQVATDVNTDDIVMDDESIPGLDDVVAAIGVDGEEEENSNVLPFGMGAKAEVLQSSLPFGVGSFSDEITEVITPSYESPELDESSEIEVAVEPDEVEPIIVELPEEIVPQDIDSVTEDVESDVEEQAAQIETVSAPGSEVVRLNASPEYVEAQVPETVEIKSIELNPVDIVEDVPDMWRIDAAEVDMDEIYSQDEQIIEVSFDDDLSSGDVEVSFDDFHHSPVEDSMASDDDAPGLHPAKALAVDASGEPELASMINSAFDYMGESAWVEAAQILSTASSNRTNDPEILNNLGLALLQSALDLDSSGDPMSSSQYEASIMALRQSAKLDPNNNTILLNLAHALLVSGRAEKAFGVLNVLRDREKANIEIENAFGACLIQLGRDEEAQKILIPYSSDAIVSGNLALL